MYEYSIELFEIVDSDGETVDFAATDDSSNSIQLNADGHHFESEAYHASTWAEENGLTLVRTTVSLKRLKEYLKTVK